MGTDIFRTDSIGGYDRGGDRTPTPASYGLRQPYSASTLSPLGVLTAAVALHVESPHPFSRVMTPLMSIVELPDVVPVSVPIVVPSPVLATHEMPKTVDFTVTRMPLETTVPFVVPDICLISSSPGLRTVVVWLQLPKDNDVSLIHRKISTRLKCPCM